MKSTYKAIVKTNGTITEKTFKALNIVDARNTVLYGWDEQGKNPDNGETEICHIDGKHAWTIEHTQQRSYWMIP